jgi:hypothetical protein
MKFCRHDFNLCGSLSVILKVVFLVVAVENPMVVSPMLPQVGEKEADVFVVL